MYDKALSNRKRYVLEAAIPCVKAHDNGRAGGLKKNSVPMLWKLVSRSRAWMDVHFCIR